MKDMLLMHAAEHSNHNQSQLFLIESSHLARQRVLFYVNFCESENANKIGCAANFINAVLCYKEHIPSKCIFLLLDTSTVHSTKGSLEEFGHLK